MPGLGFAGKDDMAPSFGTFGGLDMPRAAVPLGEALREAVLLEEAFGTVPLAEELLAMLLCTAGLFGTSVLGTTKLGDILLGTGPLMGAGGATPFPGT